MHVNLTNALFKDHKNCGENMTLADKNKLQEKKA